MAVDHDGNKKKGGVDMAVADWLQPSMQIDVSTSHLNYLVYSISLEYMFVRVSFPCCFY